ncbi:hypothetical protein AGLY_014963 [Aphis glycines]|uniref:Uncharacterized protein n=1 Tax=Aphis glycines TaxID=307491 RepID=A0A6G0T2Q0_APHGL|nr:hypothetical protein AGLY_014963 [Aphis glycines]
MLLPTTISLTVTIFGCCDFKSVLISLSDVIGNPSFSFSIFNRFKATISSVCFSLARAGRYSLGNKGGDEFFSNRMKLMNQNCQCHHQNLELILQMLLLLIYLDSMVELKILTLLSSSCSSFSFSEPDEDESFDNTTNITGYVCVFVFQDAWNDVFLLNPDVYDDLLLYALTCEL